MHWCDAQTDWLAPSTPRLGESGRGGVLGGSRGTAWTNASGSSGGCVGGG